MPRTYDIILWGCTGYTGTLAARYVARRFGFGTLRIALAGRSLHRLQAVAELMLRETEDAPEGSDVRESGKRLKQQCSEASKKNPAGRELLPFLVYPTWGQDTAVTEQQAAELASCTTVLLALAGPFSTMGEPLLKACAENGTDYVDITGEHDWVRTMWLRYDAVAKKHQARLIPCCGYDFILNDVGIAAVHEELKPCKLLDVAQHCPMGKSLPSKGTLRTILETLYQLPLAKILSPSTLRCGTLFLPHYVPLMKSWIHPTVMSQSITSYISWTNEAERYRYGQHWTFHAGERSSGAFGATFHAVSLMFLYATAFFVARTLYPLKLLNNFLKPGPVEKDAPFLRPGKSVSVETVACARKENGQVLHRRHTSLYTSTDPYTMTAAAAVTTAFTCLKLRDTSPQPNTYGVGPPSALLGIEFLQTQLRALGCTITMEEL